MGAVQLCFVVGMHTTTSVLKWMRMTLGATTTIATADSFGGGYASPPATPLPSQTAAFQRTTFLTGFVIWEIDLHPPASVNGCSHSKHQPSLLLCSSPDDVLGLRRGEKRHEIAPLSPSLHTTSISSAKNTKQKAILHFTS